VHETPDDLVRLQGLLDDSDADAGGHLRSIITPERRLPAADLARRLDGMCLLALATATADGRPIVGPVDSIFYRGAFHFGSSTDSVRFRHIRRGSAVSATHVPSEAFSVTVHGRAVEVDVRAPEHAGFRRSLLAVYVPLYGKGWERFMDDGGVAYARIEAERMFSFAMAPE
jgi:hypothetical protein